MRCYSQVGSHPHHIVISRFKSGRARQFERRSCNITYHRKLKMLCRRVKFLYDRARYEIWTEVITLKPILKVPLVVLNTIDLEIPDLGGSVEHNNI